jgi:hypothetical protein
MIFGYLSQNDDRIVLVVFSAGKKKEKRCRQETSCKDKTQRRAIIMTGERGRGEEEHDYTKPRKIKEEKSSRR